MTFTQVFLPRQDFTVEGLIDHVTELVLRSMNDQKNQAVYACYAENAGEINAYAQVLSYVMGVEDKETCFDVEGNLYVADGEDAVHSASPSTPPG